MTWAIVRNGKVVAHARFDTLEELAGWAGDRVPRHGELVMMDLRVGADVQIGTRVVVKDLNVRLGEIAASGR